ncbi:MAG TPA: urate oxidase [Tepidisphaeraceae bacterium]|nr:urate oxidase [Tepidisphaeraceae bacterium]
MSHVLSKNSYGKSQVRLAKVIRHNDHHDFVELSVNIELEGDFAKSYLDGDNSPVIATDSMKNTVYVLAADHPLTDIESFAQSLADHFLNQYTHVAMATVAIRQDRWIRVGHDHPHAFVSGGNEKRTCKISRRRSPASTERHGGIDELVVVKTTNSAFTGYVRDRFTTLPETSDRIMGTSVTADWNYIVGKHDCNGVYERARKAIIDVFAKNHSKAVQETLYQMGQAVLDACSEIDEIAITLPNQHRIPVNLEPFGLKNKNEIFVPQDEPFGLIKGTVRRG